MGIDLHFTMLMIIVTLILLMCAQIACDLNLRISNYQHSSSSLESKQNTPPAALGFPVVVNTWGIPRATTQAWASIRNGSTAIEAVIAGCSVCEDGSCGSSIGFGGSPDENGETTLDAMIMDGQTMDVGSVGCLREVESAISVAHAIMKYTKHTLLVGELATNFAVSMGFKRRSLQSKTSYNAWEHWLQTACQPNFRQNVTPDPTISCGPYKPNNTAYLKYAEHLKYSGKSSRYNPNVDEEHHDTIGMVAIDANGNIAAGTTTNGANHKIPGRVGDSPIVGAGSYAENGKGAAAATGDGDVMMRFLPSYHVVQLMGEGYDATTACRKAIARISQFYPDNYAAVVAVDSSGKHGGACHRFSPFQYNAVSGSSGGIQTYHVYCT